MILVLSFLDSHNMYEPSKYKIFQNVGILEPLVSNEIEINLEQSIPMSTNLPAIATLPQITEESVTAAATAPKEMRPKITDIFPEQEVSSTGTTSNHQTPRSSVHRKSSGRVRTISGPGTDQSRFQVNFNNS